MYTRNHLINFLFKSLCVATDGLYTNKFITTQSMDKMGITNNAIKSGCPYFQLQEYA